MRVYLKDEHGNVKEVNPRTTLIFCKDKEKHFHGIECGINPTVDITKVYINACGGKLLKIIPRASNVILVSGEKN